jgi:hypothetical protein
MSEVPDIHAVTTAAQRDALAIINMIGTGLAWGGIYSKEATRMAAKAMLTYSNEPGDQEVFAAISKWLYQQAEDR